MLRLESVECVRHGVRIALGSASLIGLLAIAACGDDSSTDSAAGDNADTDGPGTSGFEDDDADTRGGGTTAGPAVTDGPETTDTSNDTEELGSGTDDGESTGADIDEYGCSAIDCGPGGTCIEDSRGGYCSCEAVDGKQYVSAGRECIPCEGPGEDFAPDIISALVTVTATIDGVEPPRDHRDDANLVLRNFDNGDEVWLGNTHSGTVSQTVVPGVYEVYYEFESGGAQVPVNRRASLGLYNLDDAAPLSIDIPMVPLDVTVTINDAPPIDDPERFGLVWLVNPDTGDEALLGNTAFDAGSWTVNVIPGTYDVHYRAVETGAGMPFNTDAVVRSGVTVPPLLEDGTPGPLEVDITTVHVEGPLRVGGQTPPNDPSQVGRLEVYDLATGAATPLARTTESAYSIDLVAGTYSVRFRGESAGEIIPGNRNVILPGVTLDANRANSGQTINVPTTKITGVVHVDGALHSPFGSENANIFLRSEDGSDDVWIGDTQSGIYDAVVVNGLYDVRYSQVDAGSTLPVNTNAQVHAGQVEVGSDSGGAGDMPEIINVVTQQLTGSFRIGGASPPASAYDDGRVYLYDPKSGDTALLGNTREGDYSANIVAGEYSVVYSAEFSDGSVPLNKFAIVEHEDIPAIWPPADGSPVEINVSRVPLTGSLTLNGAAPEAVSPGLGSLYLERIDGQDPIYLGHTGNADFARPLAAGLYYLRYRAIPDPAGELANALPANQNAPLACIELVRGSED